MTALVQPTLKWARPAGLVLTALIVALMSGCAGYDVRTPIPELPDPPPPPPLLEFQHPYPDLVYTTVDDIDPATPGIQLEARVRVEDLANDVWLDDIALRLGEGESRLEVREDRDGVRVAVTTLTFPTPERAEPVQLRAVAESLGQAQVRFQLAR